MRAFVFPGQGSQRKGLDLGLFERYPTHLETAESVLGYSVEDVCRGDGLRSTEILQPVLFVVCSLGYLARSEDGARPDILAGHSVGEYSALFAAGAFDFETGLRILRERGRLMARANGGGMVALLGVAAEDVPDLLRRAGTTDLDVANYNARDQVVVAGPPDALEALRSFVAENVKARCVPLEVSGPFHSRYMRAAAREFEAFLRGARLADPAVPVVSNVTARTYPAGRVRSLLVEQLYSPVRWSESMTTLMERGVTELEEIGPGRVLTALWASARRAASRRLASAPPASPSTPSRGDRGDAGGANGSGREPSPESPETPDEGAITAEMLGSAEFRRDYNVRYAYATGSMYKGIASTDLVVRMGNGGLIGFFGAGGLELREIEEAIRTIRGALRPGACFGMNLLHSMHDPELEAATVELYIRHDVRFVEAAAYLQITPALVRLRYSGARYSRSGEPLPGRQVVAKVSRPETATAFMRPAPETLLNELLRQKQLTRLEAEVARKLPISGDICVEADSGGHTDGGVAAVLIPSMARLRDEAMQRHGYAKRIRIGAAGGIGTPEAVAASFVLGADFVITGSINQCSPEAGTSARVKQLLSKLDIQDTSYAPAGDMFEIGARVQVAKRGTLFPGRANRLYQLYRQFGDLEQLDAKTRGAVEGYFKRSFEDVWSETRQFYAARRPAEIERAESDPRHKMALVFKWYFVNSNRAAIRGLEDDSVNYQIQCGPAMGALNRLVEGTDLESWQERHVDRLAELLMTGAARLLTDRLRDLSGRDGARRAAPTNA